MLPPGMRSFLKYNAVHLNVSEVPRVAVTMQELMDTFVNAMVEANFNASMPLYVASGLLTYMTADGEAIRVTGGLPLADRVRNACVARRTAGMRLEKGTFSLSSIAGWG